MKIFYKICLLATLTNIYLAGYNHTFINATPFTLRFVAGYENPPLVTVCRTVNWDELQPIRTNKNGQVVNPQDIRTDNAGICLMTHVSIRAYAGQPSQWKQQPFIEAPEPWRTGDFNFGGNGTWIFEWPGAAERLYLRLDDEGNWVSSIFGSYDEQGKWHGYPFKQLSKDQIKALQGIAADGTPLKDKNGNPLPSLVKQFRIRMIDREGLGNIISRGVQTAAQQTYEHVIKPVGEGIQTAAEQSYEHALKPAGEGVADAAKKAADWVGDRFKDTQVTRAIDFAARNAALNTAYGVAYATLQSAKAVSTASLIAARKSVDVALIAAEEFLDKLVRNVAKGGLIAINESTKGVLKGVEKGTVWTIEGGRIVLTQGVLDMFDINRIYTKVRLQELLSGVLGHVEVDMTLFKQRLTPSISIDPKKGIEQLIQVLTPLVDQVVDVLQKNILGPITDAINTIGDQLKPVDTAAIQQENAQIQQTILDITQKIAAAQQEAEKTTKHLEAVHQEVTTNLDKANKEADKQLKQEIDKELKKQAMMTQRSATPLVEDQLDEGGTAEKIEAAQGQETENAIPATPIEVG